MEQKQIVILGPAHPYRGGIAMFNDRLARQLVDEGHHVVTYTFTVQYPSFLFPGTTQYTVEPKPEGLTIERKVNSVNPFNWIRVGRELKAMRPDYLIIAFWLPFMAPCMGTIARIARRNGHTRVLTILHNLLPHEPRIGDKPLSSYFIHSVDGCIVLSKSVFADIDLFDTQKPRVFSPHPLYDNFGEACMRDDACQFLRLDPQYRYLLFFGLIRDYKGLDWMLQAFAELRRNSSVPVRLIVAGEFYSAGDKYHELAEQLGIDNDVIWHTRFVPDSEVRYYFGAADMVVQPYKTATQSGVTQIAYHFEKPMLVTRVGGLSEIVPDGKVGYAVDPNPEAVARALVDFYSVGPAGRDFAPGIRDEKSKYAWNKMTDAVFSLRCTRY